MKFINLKIFLAFLLISFSTVIATEKEHNLKPRLESSLTSAAKESAVVLKSKTSMSSFDLKEVFQASPVIYSLLFFMSVTSVVILLYNAINFRPKYLMNDKTIEKLKKELYQDRYQESLVYCDKNNNLLTAMIGSGINSRNHGPQYMIDTMKSEGRRITADFWQKLSILSDISIVAPMLGLLGTVIGMFYAFYDMNRSIDSIAALFDGLGIAVGTTVAGLIVSIFAMLIHVILKYHMIKSLHLVEAEAVQIANLIKPSKA